MTSFLKLISVFLVVFTLVGCGLKGPLYYPMISQVQLFN